MFRSLAAVAALVCAAAPAAASGDPVVYSYGYAWEASQVVVADFSGKVLEVWKGDLKVGDQLPIDKEQWKPRPQFVQHGGYVGREIEGKAVKAGRVILFLSKVGKDSPDGRKEGEWAGLRADYVSAGPGGVFSQVYAPEKDGRQGVYAVARSEAEFKEAVLPIAQRRTALDAARGQVDIAKRAADLAPFAASGQAGQKEAIEALAGCGAHGVAPLAAVLFDKDAATKRYHGERARESALQGLAKIGPPAAGALVKYLERQRAFWTLTGPELGPDWYGAGNETAGLQLRLLLAALADPEAVAAVPADKRAVVRDLYELWTETPNLASVKTAGGLHPAKLLKPILDGWDKK